MVQIEDIRPSNRLGKRYVALLDNGDRIHFGQLNGNTYLDHKNIQLREAYINRHYANQIERKLIDDKIPSPALFSAALLWSFFNSNEKTLAGNVKILNRLLV
jgi:hypothetical protein